MGSNRQTPDCCLCIQFVTLNSLFTHRKILFMWLCPLCKSPISLSDIPVRCENNHTFDKAKSGYVNLLPVQFKKSKMPGDDKAMVKARRAFHQQNAYKPLKDRMVELISEHFQANLAGSSTGIPSPVRTGTHSHIPTLRIYDAGCGEGSYLNAVVNGLNSLGASSVGAGSDISKIAVELAAKAFKEQEFVVASSFDLPIASATQNAVIQVFAPGSNDEYHRVLAPEGGLLVTVDPAEDHLFEIKEQVYSEPQKHQTDNTEREGFSRVKNEKLGFSIQLADNEQALSLIKMTPFYWKLPPDSIEKVVNSLSKVTAHFHIQLWVKQ